MKVVQASLDLAGPTGGVCVFIGAGFRVGETIVVQDDEYFEAVIRRDLGDGSAMVVVNFDRVVDESFRTSK